MAALAINSLIERCPRLHPLFDLGDRLVRENVVTPCGIRGVSSPLIRKTRELSSGLPGDDNLAVVGRSFEQFLERGQFQLAPFQSRPVPLWQPEQFLARIGAISCENFNSPVSAALAGVSASFFFAEASAFLLDLFSDARLFFLAVLVLVRGAGNGITSSSPGILSRIRLSPNSPGREGQPIEQRRLDRKQPGRGEKQQTQANW